jgi:hypothetical protein
LEFKDAGAKITAFARGWPATDRPQLRRTRQSDGRDGILMLPLTIIPVRLSGILGLVAQVHMAAVASNQR